MNALTQQWIRKAEEDYRVVRRELAVHRGASLDAVCFHAQQCAEKYLKAVLQENSLAFPKTHDLEALINLLLPTQPQWSPHLPAAKVLASHAVEARYPGQWATRADAEAAFQTAADFRRVARRILIPPRSRPPKPPRTPRTK